MKSILSKVRTYSHDNGLGNSPSYKFVFDTKNNSYECINGEVLKYTKDESFHIGTALNKHEFARLVKESEGTI